MKSIKDLLEKMNESDKFSSKRHVFKIYADGSGGIYDNTKNLIKSWGLGKNNLEAALNALEDKLNENEKSSWTL